MRKQTNIDSSISTCNEYIPDQVSTLMGFSTPPVGDSMQIYDTDQDENRIGFYCLGGETRDIIHWSDWNDIYLTIWRGKRMVPLWINLMYASVQGRFGGEIHFSIDFTMQLQ